jgi:hypothetical protein
MSLEQRVFSHYKALKMSQYSDGAAERYGAKTYIVTPNHVWLRLARTHKIPVRQVKDIITAERERRAESRRT